MSSFHSLKERLETVKNLHRYFYLLENKLKDLDIYINSNDYCLPNIRSNTNIRQQTKEKSIRFSIAYF